MGRSVVELFEGDLARGIADDVVWPASECETTARQLPGWGSPYQEGNEAIRSTLGTIQGVTQV